MLGQAKYVSATEKTMPPRRPPRPARKRRTREHIIADLSIYHHEGPILRCGFTVEHVVHDYGVDLYMATYNVDGEMDNDFVLFQLKATDHVKRSADNSAIRFRLDRADLDWWLAETYPVILIVYDAQADVAFWLYIQTRFERIKLSLGTSTKSVTVHIPLTNVVNEAAIHHFAAAKAAVQAQTKGVRPA
jgi:Domain of unknown function (DUF4365)